MLNFSVAEKATMYKGAQYGIHLLQSRHRTVRLETSLLNYEQAHTTNVVVSPRAQIPDARSTSTCTGNWLGSAEGRSEQTSNMATSTSFHSVINERTRISEAIIINHDNLVSVRGSNSFHAVQTAASLTQLSPTLLEVPRR